MLSHIADIRAEPNSAMAHGGYVKIKRGAAWRQISSAEPDGRRRRCPVREALTRTASPDCPVRPQLTSLPARRLCAGGPGTTSIRSAGSGGKALNPPREYARDS